MIWDNWMHGSASWMVLWMLLFWGALVAVIVLVLRDTRAGDRTPADVRAREVLLERFARGEIDGQEFQARMRAIEGLMR